MVLCAVPRCSAIKNVTAPIWSRQSMQGPGSPQSQTRRGSLDINELFSTGDPFQVGVLNPKPTNPFALPGGGWGWGS